MLSKHLLIVQSRIVKIGFWQKSLFLKELVFVSKLIEIAMLKQIQIVVNKTSILASRGTKEVFKTVYRISSYQIYLMF